MKIKKNIAWTATIILCLSFMVSASLPAQGEETATFTVNYSDCWSGSYGAEGSSTSIDGCGTESYTATGTVFSMVIQKDDDSANELCVSISVAGKEKSACTTAEYGIASVATDAFEEEAGDMASMMMTCCGASLLILIVFWFWRNRQKKKQIASAVSQGVADAMASQPGYTPPSHPATSPPEEDNFAKIKEAKQLFDSGAITEDEFNEMKKKYL